MNKRNLKIITAILALIPTITGIVGFAGINDPLYNGILHSKNILLDSNLRFYSGVWLGLGLAMLSIVKSIEKNKQVFRVIWLSIFLGGIGRLFSIIFEGIPPGPFIGFTALEIIGAPFFVFWQSKIAEDK